MIEVTYYRRQNRVTIDGHAGAGQPGYDLVCSAASILARTLCANVEHMAQERMVEKAVTQIREGHAEIGCRPYAGYRTRARNTFESVCVGFEILQDGAPEYINYHVR